MEAQPFWVANNPNIGTNPTTPNQAIAPDTADLEPLSKAEAKKLQVAQFYSHVYNWLLADSHVIVERVRVPITATKAEMQAAQAETAARIAAADVRAAELIASPYMKPEGFRQRRALRKAHGQSKKLGDASGKVKFHGRIRQNLDANRAVGRITKRPVTEADRKAHIQGVMAQVRSGTMTEHQARQVAEHQPHVSHPNHGQFTFQKLTELEQNTPYVPDEAELKAFDAYGRMMSKIDPLRRKSVEAEVERQALRAEKLNDPERRVDWAVAQEAARVEAFRPLFWQRVAEWTNHNLTEASNNGQNLSLEQAQKQARERTMHDLLPYYLGLHEVGDYERLSKQRKEQFASLFGFSTPRRPAEAPSSGYTQF